MGAGATFAFYSPTDRILLRGTKVVNSSAKAALKEGFTTCLRREAQNSADGRRYLQTRW
jgi:hypothetical protein